MDVTLQFIVGSDAVTSGIFFKIKDYFSLFLFFLQNTVPSMNATSFFGNSLLGVMALQAEHFPERKLPWIQTTLTEALLQRNGASTEGVFR